MTTKHSRKYYTPILGTYLYVNTCKSWAGLTTLLATMIIAFFGELRVGRAGWKLTEFYLAIYDTVPELILNP